jgi:hypothetical protein
MTNKPADDRIQDVLEKRIEKFSFSLDAMDKNILYSALELELNRQYANYGKRVLSDDEGNPENSHKRIQRIKALMDKVANLNYMGETEVKDV